VDDIDATQRLFLNGSVSGSAVKGDGCGIRRSGRDLESGGRGFSLVQRFEQGAPDASAKVCRADRDSIEIDHVADTLVAEDTGKLPFVERSEHDEVERRYIGWRFDETRHLVIANESSLHRIRRLLQRHNRPGGRKLTVVKNDHLTHGHQRSQCESGQLANQLYLVEDQNHPEWPCYTPEPNVMQKVIGDATCVAAPQPAELVDSVVSTGQNIDL
jgi:hypothetical protein